MVVDDSDTQVLNVDLELCGSGLKCFDSSVDPGLLLVGHGHLCHLRSKLRFLNLNRALE